MRVIAFFAAAALAALSVEAKKKEGDPKECEVCVKILTDISSKLSDSDRKDIVTIENKISKYCSNKQLSQNEKKVCYFIEPIRREISRPFKNGVPADRVCKRLKQKSAEICSVRTAVKVEKGTTDYSKLRIRDLKKILADRGQVCKNCLEKSEFVKMCKETEHLEL